MTHDHYIDRASRIDTLASPEDRDFWTMILKLSDEYIGPKNEVFGTPKNWDTFNAWCAEHHGFMAITEQDGGIRPDPVIIDEQKYMLCLLKYGG